MLDSDTKRRIDTCRDILVGKVPDPKSQVEQITIALIYKFMDDMDAEAEELGGRRSFFAGEYEKYGWARLMSPALGGVEMLGLYAEAITTMGTNPGIPTLFRDIFKNAYLPYRDPETLRAFLKEIHGFTYDHSERLGDAFEYLLLVLGSQGDAGQFRTPRHIIDFIVDVVDPQKTDTILDPACGTAGFLISSYKHILASNRDTPLTTDERTHLARNLIGYDISPDMVRLSLVNLYLHGFLQPQVEEYDTLTSDEKWTTYADVILANPPFMSPKGGIKPHKRFSVQSNRSEVLFVDYIAEHLTPTGRAGVIVPEGIIFQSGGAYKTLREMLVKNYLVAVVSLPAGVFQPYSGVKTSILVMDRQLAKRADSILFVKIASDGFGLGAQRRAVAVNDLPAAARQLKAWFGHLRGEAPRPPILGEQIAPRPPILGESEFDTAGAGNVHVVEKAQIAASGDYNLSGDRYVIGKITGINAFPMVKLGAVCERITGSIDPSEFSGDVNYVGLENIESDTGILSGDISARYEDIKSTKTRFVAGHILYGKLRPNLNKVYLARQSGICSTDIFVLQAKEGVDASFIAQMVRSRFFNIEVLKGLGGAQLPRVSFDYLRCLEIPLPPLSVQQEIVAEIKGYQKVIDGARQVVENYKPRIEIDPEWPVVELREACEAIMDGTHFSPENSAKGEVRYVTAKNIKEHGLDFSSSTYVTQEEHDKIYSRCPVKKGDVLYIKDGATAGIATINTLDDEFSLLSSVAVLRGRANLLDNRFLTLYLNSQQGKEAMLSLVSGVAITRLTLTKINAATIPLPPLETQQATVAQIEDEQRLVEGNRELIRRFEGKVTAAINRVWGAA